MPNYLQLGPFTFSWALLLLFGGWWLGSSLQERLAKRQGLAPGPHGWWLMLLSLLMARLGFVQAYWADYAAAPAGLWAVLDIRDGGWQPWWGLAAALAYAAVLLLRRSPWARSVAAGLGAGAALWLGGQGLQYFSASAAPALPAWQGIALDGSPVQLRQLQGQPVVVNLWASWCPPCRREMPAMLQAQAQHPEVRFIWVNQGEAVQTVLGFAQQQGLPPAQVLLDVDKSLSQQLGSHALPTTFFYRADGSLAHVRTGEVSAATLSHYLRD